VFGAPDAASLDAIATAALRGSFTCWRTMPSSLKPLWSSILAKVALWGPWALLLAPVVLLRRATDAPAKRLQQLALNEDLLRQYFWNAANTDTPAPREAPALTPEERARLQLIKVEQRAAHAPAAALRMLYGVPPSSPEDAAPSLVEKFAPVPPARLTAGLTTAKPAWLHAEQFVAVARRLARAVAPGVDGWTRELLLASIHPALHPAWEGLINAIVCNAVPSGPMAALVRSARLAAWPKPAPSVGHRIVGMTSAVTKACWRAVLAMHLRCRSFHPCMATFASGGSTAVVRWASKLPRVVSADIKDAFWSVDRKEVATLLERDNSPAALMYILIYGESPIVVHGTRQ
jgi:hypothetical protein